MGDAGDTERIGHVRLGVASAIVGDEVVDGDVEVADGRIAAVGVPGGGGSGLAVPGFVDLHVHGHGGVDFGAATRADHVRIARSLPSSGVTAYHPTLMSMPLEALVDALGRHPGHVTDGARVLGFHLEGPFLAPARRGAHPPEALLHPTPPILGRLLDAGPVAHVTLAPELPGALDAIDVLASAGVVVSLGHSIASSEITVEAIGRGARAFTHVFNAMEPFGHRRPGMVGVALSRADVFPTAIFDGVHLSREAATIVIRCAGTRLVAITDGTSAIGGERAMLGGATVETSGGVPRLPDGTIAGSLLTMDTAFRNLVDLGLAPVAAVGATSTVPARLAGLDDTGTLAPGSRADVAILDDGLAVVRTLVGGVPVFGG